MERITIELLLDKDVARRLREFCQARNIEIADVVRDHLISLVANASSATEISSERPNISTSAVSAELLASHQKSTSRYSVEILARTENLRMVLIHLPQGGEVPWHYHTEVFDRFFCLKTPIVIEAREPSERFELVPGDTCLIAPGRPHHVTSLDGQECTFALLQGVGRYDFVPCP